jgi:hypothetical protein
VDTCSTSPIRAAPTGVPIVRWLRAGPQALAGWLAGFGVMFLSLFPVSWLAPQGAAWCPFAVGAMASWVSAYCVCRWLLLVAGRVSKGSARRFC